MIIEKRKMKKKSNISEMSNRSAKGALNVGLGGY